MNEPDKKMLAAMVHVSEVMNDPQVLEMRRRSREHLKELKAEAVNGMTKRKPAPSPIDEITEGERRTVPLSPSQRAELGFPPDDMAIPPEPEQPEPIVE